jgi:hypothetical protein
VFDHVKSYVASFEREIELGHSGTTFRSGSIDKRPCQTFVLVAFVDGTFSKSGVRAFVRGHYSLTAASCWFNQQSIAIACR